MRKEARELGIKIPRGMAKRGSSWTEVQELDVWVSVPGFGYGNEPQDFADARAAGTAVELMVYPFKHSEPGTHYGLRVCADDVQSSA